LKIAITTNKNQNEEGYTYGHNSVPRPPPLESDGANESQQPAQQSLVVRFAPTSTPTQWINEQAINERMMNEQKTNTAQHNNQPDDNDEQPNNEQSNNHELTMKK
jgi:hypothetical protein